MELGVRCTLLDILIYFTCVACDCRPLFVAGGYLCACRCCLRLFAAICRSCLFVSACLYLLLFGSSSAVVSF